MSTHIEALVAAAVLVTYYAVQIIVGGVVP
jgi:hypothetical protein